MYIYEDSVRETFYVKRYKENIITLEKAMFKRCAFRKALKRSRDVALLTLSGNLFHKHGPETLNAQSS